MRLNLTLTLACFVAFASLVHAQVPPTSTLPRGPAMRIQPTPTGKTPIQPTPTGRVTPASAYPPAVSQMNAISNAFNLNQNQIIRPAGLTDQGQWQSLPTNGNTDTLGDAARFGLIQEPNQQLPTGLNNGTAPIINPGQPLPFQQWNSTPGGLVTMMHPDVPNQVNLTNADWSTPRRYSVITRPGTTDAMKGMAPYGDSGTLYPWKFDTLLTPEQRKDGAR
jgi:hypothetical protein